MTVTQEVLVENTQVANSTTTYYTCPANTKVVLTNFHAYNPSAGAETLTVWIVDSGDTADDVSEKYKTSIATDTPVTLSDLHGVVLEAGDFIAASCSTATTINIRVSGRAIV